MSGEASPPQKTGGFSSIKNIWQERVKEVEGAGRPPVVIQKKDVPPQPVTKFPSRSSGRTSSGGSSAPPQSPSSRANAILSQPQDAAADPFQQYGIAFVEDNTGLVTIRKVIPGSPADQAGLLFPGDALHEVNGIEVYKWPLDRVTPLASGDRAGSTLRLAFERLGFPDMIHVELEMGKNYLRPSPSPSPSLSPSSEPRPPAKMSENTRDVSMPAQPQQPGRESPESSSQVEGSSQDYEEYQVVPPRPSSEDKGDVKDDKDEMRMNVVKRYKSRIQELSQSLEASQVSSAKQARQVEELNRFLNEKDELLKELREAVSKLTNKLEESSRENYDMRLKMNELGPAESSAKTSGGETSSVNREVQRLKMELDAMRNQRDIAQLSSVPSDDASDILREMKLQVIEKDAKIQDLEGKIASLRRSNVIQAVELQELHDHVAGMEKQKMAMQVQQFPPLPPLQSVTESPFETPMDEDDKMKAIMLADEVLKKAQDEIALLKQKDQRRIQLEAWAEQSQLEIQRLRKELEHQAAESGRSSRAGDVESLQLQLSRSLSQVDLLKQQVAGLEDLKIKTADLQKKNINLEAQIQTLRAPHGPPGPSAAGPIDVDLPGSLLDHPVMQHLGMLDKKQLELQEHIAALAAMPTSGCAGDAQNQSTEMHQLRAQLRAQDAALAKLTSSINPSEKSNADLLIAETHKVEVLKVQVEDFARNTQLMNTELELVKNAYSQSRQQYLAAEVEIKMLRTHLDAIKRDGDAQETASSARDEESKTANENSAHSARLFESVIQEKRVLEEALSKIRDEKLFVERCLTDARLNISRLEAEHESENTSFHEANLAVAKVEGKLQAANTRVSSLEKELQKKKDDILDLNDEIKRTRQSMIQSDSEKNLQNNTLRNELLFLKDQNEKMKREFDQLSIQHKELLSAHEDPSKIASEKTSPTAIESKLQEQKDQQLASFAEQLKGQKDKALQVRLNVCLCLCLCQCLQRAIIKKMHDTDGLWYFQAEAVAQAATVRQQRAEDELQRIREELVRVLSMRLVG